jgi:hypothetical protein
MILPDYISCQWLQNSFDMWKQKCTNAHDAETIEMLYEVPYIFILLSLHYFVWKVVI